MPKFLTVGQKREYMKRYHQEHPDQRRRYRPEKSKIKDPGIRVCLKCDEQFKSPDRVNFRLCPKCRETNKSLTYLEGWDS